MSNERDDQVQPENATDEITTSDATDSEVVQVDTDQTPDLPATVEAKALTPSNGYGLLLQQVPADVLAEAEKIAAGLKFESTLDVTNFGQAELGNLRNFNENVVEGFRVKDTGPFAELVIDMRRTIDSVDPDALKKGENWLESKLTKLPVVGPRFSALYKFKERYADADDTMAEIEEGFENGIKQEDKNIEKGDSLIALNLQHLRFFTVQIVSGLLKLRDMLDDYSTKRAAVVAKRAAGEVVPDDELQALKTLHRQILFLDQTLFSLQGMRIAAMTTGPVIEETQNGSVAIRRFLAETLMGAVTEWRKLCALAEIHHTQAKNLEVVAQGRAISDEMQRRTMDSLEGVHDTIKEQEGRGLYSVDTLVEKTHRLRSLLERAEQMDMANIQKRIEGRAKLQEAERALKKTVEHYAASIPGALPEADSIPQIEAPQE